MINPEDFYGNEKRMSKQTKNRMWNNIKEEVIPKRSGLGYFDIRSFSLGLAAALVAIFTVIGMYTVGRYFIYESKPVDLKINSAYQKAIYEFEKTLPSVSFTKNESVEVDELLQVKHEELKEINSALDQYSREYSLNDVSKYKQERLRNLYKQKLEALETIITLEGRNDEK